MSLRLRVSNAMMSAFPAATSPQMSCGTSEVTDLYSSKDYVTTAQILNDNIFYRLSINSCWSFRD